MPRGRAGLQRERPADQHAAALVDALEACLRVGDGLDRIPRQPGRRIEVELDPQSRIAVAERQLVGAIEVARSVMRGADQRAGAGVDPLVRRRRVAAAAHQVEGELEPEVHVHGPVAPVLDLQRDLQRRVEPAAAEDQALGDRDRLRRALGVLEEAPLSTDLQCPRRERDELPWPVGEVPQVRHAACGQRDRVEPGRGRVHVGGRGVREVVLRGRRAVGRQEEDERAPALVAGRRRAAMPGPAP